MIVSSIAVGKEKPEKTAIAALNGPSFGEQSRQRFEPANEEMTSRAAKEKPN